MQPVISTRNLIKRYGTTIALEDVSLEVGGGEIFGFLGPNGAGKSTFVKILLSLVRPTAGEARIFGIPVREPRARKNVGYLPEHIRIHDFLTVREFIRLHAHLAGIDRSDVDREVDRCLEMLGVLSVRSRKIGTLSKGMLQRVGIAQAIVGDPELLILDEPTSGLDPIGFTDLRNLLLAMRRRGTTIFLNSHILSEVERTCDKVAILHHGRIIAAGRPGDIAGKERHVEIVAEGITEEMLEQMRSLCTTTPQRDGTVIRAYPQSEQDAARIHAIIASMGGKVRSFCWKGETLEDLFCRLVKDEITQNHRARN